MGEGVDEAGDPAFGAEGDALENEVVYAAEEDEAVADGVAKVGEAADVFGGFLDGDDVGLVGEFGEGVRQKIDAVGDRVVVDHDGQAGGIGDGAEVGEGLALIGFVDHAGEDHEAFGAELLASRAKRQASAVVYSATPVRTGMRPLAVFFSSRIISSFSRSRGRCFLPRCRARRRRECRHRSWRSGVWTLRRDRGSGRAGTGW